MNSYNFGPITVDPNKRDEFLQFEEIGFGVETILVDDSNIIDATREESIINVFRTREATESLKNWVFAEGTDERHLIKTKHLVMFDVYKAHERHVTAFIDEVSDFGGFWSILEYTFMTILAIFGSPYTDLKFALGTNELMAKLTAKRD